MDIIKLINPDGSCKLEIVSNDYNKDKQILEEICNATRNIVSGNSERIETANEVLTDLLWQSTEKFSLAKQEIKKLQETVEFDNMQIAHYDDELKQAETLLKTILPCTGCADARNRIEKFLNRGANDDENS